MWVALTWVGRARLVWVCLLNLRVYTDENSQREWPVRFRRPTTQPLFTIPMSWKAFSEYRKVSKGVRTQISCNEHRLTETIRGGKMICWVFDFFPVCSWYIQNVALAALIHSLDCRSRSHEVTMPHTALSWHQSIPYNSLVAVAFPATRPEPKSLDKWQMTDLHWLGNVVYQHADYNSQMNASCAIHAIKN